MRKILGIVAAALVLGSAFVSCKKSPTQQLAESIDSVNVVLSKGAVVDFPAGITAKYDEPTNTVKFDLNVPLDLNQVSLSDVEMEQFQSNFVNALLNGMPQVASKIEAVHANVLLSLIGQNNSKIEIMTDPERLADIKSLAGKQEVLVQEEQAAAADSAANPVMSTSEEDIPATTKLQNR